MYSTTGSAQTTVIDLVPLKWLAKTPAFSFPKLTQVVRVCQNANYVESANSKVLLAASKLGRVFAIGDQASSATGRWKPSQATLRLFDFSSRSNS